MTQSNKQPQEPKPLKKNVIETDGIKNLDIMGERFKFGYSKTSKRFETNLGGCLTLLITILSVAVLVLILSQYFDTSSPVVTTSRELSTEAQSINLYGKELFSWISLGQGGVFEPLKMNNYVTIQGQIVKKTFDPQTNSTKIDLSQKYNYIPCPEITEDRSVIDLTNKMIENADLRVVLCPHFKEVNNEVTLSYDPENLSSSYIIVKVYPCSLPNRNDCYPIERVFGTEVTFGEVSRLVSPSNYKNPVDFQWTALGQVIDVSRSKSFMYELKQNKITDDRQFLRKPKVKAEYEIFKQFTADSWERDMSQLYCTSAMIGSGECQVYMEFVYEMNNEVFVTKRIYKKIPALLGEFGGILKLLTTAFVILSFYYSMAIKSFLFSKVFDLKKSKVKKILKRAEDTLEGEEGKTIQNNTNQQSEANTKHRQREQPTLQQQKTKKSKKIINSRINKSLKKALDSKTDITEVVKKINLVDMLTGACLEKHHQILLPLLLLRLKQSPPKDQAEGPEALAWDPTWASSLNKNSSAEEAEFNKDSVEKNQGSEKKQKEEILEGKKFYNALKEVKPKNKLEKMFNEEILGYLSLVYEQE